MFWEQRLRSVELEKAFMKGDEIFGVTLYDYKRISSSNQEL